MTLSGDRVENNEVSKFINWIIKELDLTAIIVKSDKINSSSIGKVDEIDQILVKAKFKKISKLSKSKNLQISVSEQSIFLSSKVSNIL